LKNRRRLTDSGLAHKKGMGLKTRVAKDENFCCVRRFAGGEGWLLRSLAD
jgi:hypothetical protein